MGVRLVGEEEPSGEMERAMQTILPERPETPPPPKPQPMQTPGRAMESLIEVQAKIARMLGFRTQLLLAFLGAAATSGWAIANPSPETLVAAGLYDLLVFLPVLFVAYKRG